MGGEGFQPELDLIRNHAGVNAVMISPSDWTGWAAIDTMNSLFRKEKPAFSGLGWQLVDPTHNMPASGPWQSPVDFKAIYKKAWGIS
jgi:ribose transport system substrate-binding protein